MGMGIGDTAQGLGQAHLLGRLIGSDFKEAIALHRSRRNFNVGCKSTIVVVRHGSAADAEVFAPGSTVLAFAAGQYDVHHYPVSFLHIGMGIAGFDYAPTKLVAQHAGRGNFFVAIAVGAQVGAADTTGFDLQEDFAVGKNGIGDVFDTDVLFSAVDGCFHRFLVTMPTPTSPRSRPRINSWVWGSWWPPTTEVVGWHDVNILQRFKIAG